MPSTEFILILSVNFFTSWARQTAAPATDFATLQRNCKSPHFGFLDLQSGMEGGPGGLGMLGTLIFGVSILADSLMS